MFILYDFIALIFTLVHLPVYLFKRKFHPGFSQRLGFLPKGLKLNRPIWIHAVSVGEVMAIKGLLAQLRKLYPDKQFVISTVTSTGNKIAQGVAQGEDTVLYLPLDFSFIVRNVISRVNPSLFILAETEIWPNLISCLYRMKIPVIVVNGRISDGSFKGYSAIKIFLRPIFRKVSLFLVQSAPDAQRLNILGVPEGKVKVSGNMKFDIALNINPIEGRNKLGIGLQEKLFVAGSTHSGEEEIILDAFYQVHRKFPMLKLLIAPRHPERAAEVAQIISRYGFGSVCISKLPFFCRPCVPEPVFVLDSVGELVSFYAAADIVFVGGSLIKKGGHNILEPACFAKPIICGEHMFNFRETAELFKENNAAIFVHRLQDLKVAIENLLSDTRLREELGKRAQELILKNQGATFKNTEFIKGLAG